MLRVKPFCISLAAVFFCGLLLAVAAVSTTASAFPGRNSVAANQNTKIISGRSYETADSSQTKLAIDFAANQTGKLIVPAKPGSSHKIPLILRNENSKAIEARTFAADPMTLTNGGFSAESWGSAKTGATKWVRYPNDTFLMSGKSRQGRTAVVTVPKDANPGEYVVGLTIQNAKPVGYSKNGGIQLGQIRRQIIAIVINIPGPAKPAITFGGATYDNNTNQFFKVDLAVANTGNRILRPAVELVLKDSNNEPVQTSKFTMSGFYPATSTKLELSLEKPLPNGQYYVDATMTDALLSQPAIARDVPLTISDKSNEASGGSPAAPLPKWVWIVIGLVVVLILVAIYVLLRRRKARAIEARAAIPQSVRVAEVLGFLGDRVLGFKGDPVGRLVIAKDSGGLVGLSENGETASGALVAVASVTQLDTAAARSALVTPEVLDQANSAGDSYSGPETLIAVANPQLELDAIQTHFLYRKS